MTYNSGANILLVEDEDQLRSLCRRALEADGATVVEAHDGETALTRVQEWSPSFDLVITDLAMPGLGGREIAEVLSVFRPELPVLAISGDPGTPDRRLPMLLKPFSLADLVEAAGLLRTRASRMREWAQEKRFRARQARQVALEMQARTAALRDKVDLLAVARELQRLDRGGIIATR